MAEFAISQPPRDYFSDLYYDAVVHDSSAPQLTIDIAGPYQLLFGTDLPMLAHVPKPKDFVEGRPADEAAVIHGRITVRVFVL